ncbi:Unannotated [Lentimonas sp. CC19]|nr:Unannotated [Lentimonas sp. CC19]CAA6693488.1 Unannotated [Lentimonas sp. CC10]
MIRASIYSSQDHGFCYAKTASYTMGLKLVRVIALLCKMQSAIKKASRRFEEAFDEISDSVVA